MSASSSKISVQVLGIGAFALTSFAGAPQMGETIVEEGLQGAYHLIEIDPEIGVAAFMQAMVGLACRLNAVLKNFDFAINRVSFDLCVNASSQYLTESESMVVAMSCPVSLLFPFRKRG